MNSFEPTKSQIFGSFDSFRLLITASSGSGKSQLVKTLMLDPSMGLYYKFAIDKVFVFSPTLHIDDAWVDVKDSLEKRSTKELKSSENSQRSMVKGYGG